MTSFQKRTAFALIVMIAGTLLASLFYSGGYNYISDPISALGRSYTVDGLKNTVSRIIFTVTCITTSILLFYACFDSLKWTIIIAASGLLLMPIPCDLYPLGHQIASGIAVGGAYFYCSIYLFRMKNSLIWFLVFQAAVLIYAYLHVSGSPLKEEFQTLAVIVIITTMLLSTRSPRGTDNPDISCGQTKSPNSMQESGPDI